MQLFELVKKESEEGVGRDTFLAAGLSGLANAGILVIINAAALTASQDTLNFRYLAMFLVIIALLITSLGFTLNKINRIFESAVHNLRKRIVHKIRTSELAILESIGTDKIYTVMTQETLVIAESGMPLTASLHSAIMVFFATLYLLYLSLPAFLITVLLVSAGLILYLDRDRETKQYMQESISKRIEFLSAFTHTIEGFKETKLNRKRGDDLIQDVERISNTLKELRVKTTDLYNSNYIFSQCFFYCLIASIIFLLPRLIPTYDEVIIQVAMAILFVIGPLSMVVATIPVLAKANHAAQQIRTLERDLDRLRETLEEEEAPPLRSFSTVTLDNVQFSYNHERTMSRFTLGPLSLEIRAGEILFITGGNGSGKSTLVKLLAALYYPEAGEIRVDGTLVGPGNIQSYRELFTAIFSDFHLFDKLYGLLGTEEQKVKDLLAQMQLSDKTGFTANRFTNLELSTGQRKRLALVVCLLDDKPIFLFDELAADQDPSFREYLYKTLLADLKAKGKTVVAVTHDDRYFHLADRLIKIEFGKVDSITEHV